MQTLDEVIDNMQLTGEVNRHYREEHADVLHYLRMYQSALKALDENQQAVEDAVRQRDKHIKALAELKRNQDELSALREYWAKDQENPPLTWEELTGMVGQPVWIEYSGTKPLSSGWGLVSCASFTTWEGVPCLSLVKIGVTYALPIKEYGKTWRTYRKERS